MNLADLETDLDKIEQGRWIDDIPGMGELRLHVRGLGNTDYRRLFDKKVAAVPRSRKIRGLQSDDRERIVGECVHESVLLGWGGLKNRDGSDLAFDRDLARDMLTNPKFVKFRAAVIWAADLVAEEAGEDIKADTGN